MFGWLKRKTSAAPAMTSTAGDGGEPVLAAPLLADPAFNLADALPAVAKLKVAGHRVTGVRFADGVLSGQWAGGILGAVVRPHPYPWSDLEGPVATSWMWPPHTPATSVKPHRAHGILTLVGGGGSAVERRLLLTRVTAEVAALPGVLGVYWPEGTTVHYPSVFVQMGRKITTAAAPPLYLWVDFRAFRNADGSGGLFTTGMRALGSVDFEMPRIDMPPGELRDWAVNIAYYLLAPTTNVKDGDTIVMSAEHQIKVRYRPSSFGGKDVVLRLET